MTVVKINAITVPEGMGPELERRFAARKGDVDSMPGFVRFELLRPVSGDDRYFVVTHWETEEHFQAWVQSQDFKHAHARAESSDGKPVAPQATLLAFEVVDLQTPEKAS